ncbi:MAG: hypothetical protein AAGA30_07945 [Planctomycetota bacterium]
MTIFKFGENFVAIGIHKGDEQPPILLEMQWKIEGDDLVTYDEFAGFEHRYRFIKIDDTKLVLENEKKRRVIWKKLKYSPAKIGL